MDENLGESVKNDLDLLDQILVETSYETLLVRCYLVQELSHYRNLKKNAQRDGDF